ncbi:MAG: LysM peptidoglycan-binding domain-containing protein [bacterium]|nr:LysM peptidoglycan-binding domain-containing protein [bacterium]
MSKITGVETAKIIVSKKNNEANHASKNTSIIFYKNEYNEISDKLIKEDDNTLTNNQNLQALEINPYTISKMTTDNAILKSQKNVIDLIRYYEGHKNENNEYVANTSSKDKYDISTYGFGLRKLAMKSIGKAKNVNGELTVTNPPKTEAEAFEQLFEYLNKVSKTEICSYLSKDTYEKLPNSIKEALLDYQFKNGTKIMSNSGLKELVSNALKNNNWVPVLKNLVYAKPASDSKAANDPGIYRRSLSRVILAANGLKQLPNVNKTLIDAAVKEIYDDAIKCAKANNKPTKDFDDIYNTYTGQIAQITNQSNNTNSTNTSNIAQYKCMSETSLYKTALALRPQGEGKEFTIALIEKLAELNNIKLANNDSNGFPNPSRMFNKDETITVPTTLKFKHKEYKLNKLANGSGWTTVHPPQKIVPDKPIVIINNQPINPHIQTTQRFQYQPSINTTYTVQKGEGYQAIARKYLPKEASGLEIKTYADSISAANANKPLQPGMVIVIPNANFPKNLEEIAEAKAQTQENHDMTGTAIDKLVQKTTCTTKDVGKSKLKLLNFEYTIQKGDNLNKISSEFGIDKKTLMDENDIKNPDKIKEGDKIKVIKIAYQVKKGDNLAQIAKMYGLNTNFLKDLNRIENSDKLEIGQYIEIPGYTYSVKKGDNLTQIAQKADIDVATLKKINGLSWRGKINAGQELVILFNNIDYNRETKITETKDNTGKTTQVQTVNMANEVGNRVYLKEKRKIKNANGNIQVVANKHIFEPTITNGPLSGKTIMVNAGHGYGTTKDDPGALGRDNLPHEYLINYDNAMTLTEKLRAKGAKVIYVQGREGKDSIGEALISNEIRNNKIDMFISIHVNCSENPESKQKDRMEIQHYRDGSSEFAEIFRGKVDNYVKNNSGNYTDNPDYVLLKPTGTQVLVTASTKKTPAILWEVAFMNSPAGRKRLSNSKLIDNYCNLLTDSCVDYFKNEANYIYYKVQSGDYLDKIAKQHNTTAEKIKNLNGLKNDKIRVGQTLKVGKKVK